jgi:hypothetical protein
MRQQPSFREIEKLSAYLDDQLSRSDRVRLEARLESDTQLQGILLELRQARSLLKRTPRVRVPHNFILTPKMMGNRPPLPRSVPVFRLASITAAFMLFVSFAMNLLTPMAASPSLAAVPYGIGGGGCDTSISGSCQDVAPQIESGRGAGPQETSIPAQGTSMTLAPLTTAPTPTLEPSPEPGLRTMEQPTQAAAIPAPTEVLTVQAVTSEKAQTQSVLNSFQIALIILFLVFGCMALIIHRMTILKWRKRQ